MNESLQQFINRLEDKWLGNKKIKFGKEAGQNNNGMPEIEVFFDDGTKGIWTLKMLQAPGVVTPNPLDLTQFREVQVVALVSDMLKLLLDYSPREKDITYVVQKFEASIVENITKAQNKLWGIENVGEQTFGAVDKVLLGE